MVEQKEWTVIFPIDKNPPTRIVLLRRAPDKDFAPNYYTGLGGKVGDLPEFKDEAPLESAYRELSEETEGGLSNENTTLVEFARCVYESGLILYYFACVFPHEQTPTVNPKDGSLEWVETEKLFDRQFIPTTETVCTEWAKRGFRIDQPFTVHVREGGKRDTVRLVEITKVIDGLDDF